MVFPLGDIPSGYPHWHGIFVLLYQTNPNLVKYQWKQQWLPVDPVRTVDVLPVDISPVDMMEWPTFVYDFHVSYNNVNCVIFCSRAQEVTSSGMSLDLCDAGMSTDGDSQAGSECYAGELKTFFYFSKHFYFCCSRIFGYPYKMQHLPSKILNLVWICQKLNNISELISFFNLDMNWHYLCIPYTYSFNHRKVLEFRMAYMKVMNYTCLAANFTCHGKHLCVYLEIIMSIPHFILYYFMLYCFKNLFYF